MARTHSAAGTVAAAPDITSGAAATAARQPNQRHRLRKRVELTVLLVPPLVLFIGFVLVPMVFAAWYSLYNWSGFGPLADFIGLQNYGGVLTGPDFHAAFEHNLIIAALSVLIQL